MNSSDSLTEAKKPRKVSLIMGTRPEAIKLCPVVLALREHPDFEPHVCVTGQHREMLDQVLEVFGIVPSSDGGENPAILPSATPRRKNGSMLCKAAAR